METEHADPALHSTFGALYVGMVVSAALWGVSCVQTWYYFDNYRRDSLMLRCVVFACWLSDTIHQCLITHVLYSYTISHFGDTDYLEKVVWSLYAEVIFNGLTGFLVQSFFTYRIWTFRRNIPIVFGISLLVLAELGTSVAYVIQGGHLPTFVELKELKPLSMSINVLAAAGDVAISAAICTFLNSAKSGFAWSNHIINRLMLFSINTGLLTSICACCSLIFILSLPNTLVYFAFYFTIGRFYSNSLLATLNARKGMHSSSNEPESHSLQDRTRDTSHFGRALALLSVHDNKPQVGSQQIQVQIETIKHDYMGDEIDIRNDTGLVTSSGQSLDDLGKTPSDFPYTGQS